jgi:N-acetyltransferase
MAFNLQPTLENELLFLRPLKKNDFENLFKVASDPLIWEQHPAKDRRDREGFTVFFDHGIAAKSAFAVIDKKTGEIIGTSRYNAVPETENAIEIGWTFLARAYWGGTHNQSMKKLMMDYAFQYVDNILFFINEKNWRSRKAVEKIWGVRIVSLEGKMIDPRSPVGVIYKVSKKSTPSV